MPRRGVSGGVVRGPQRSDVLWERAKVVVQTLSMKSFDGAMSKAQVALRDHDMRRLGEIYQSALEVEVRLLEEIELALSYEDEDDVRGEATVDDQVAAKVASHGLWILARVVATTDDDWLDVEDVDDDTQRRYHIKRTDTLMLPRTRGEIALARASYKPPNFVFAMYPETTSFYKAQVIAPPHISSSSSEEVCLVQFVDDEDDQGTTPTRSIPLGFIAHLPSS